MLIFVDGAKQIRIIRSNPDDSEGPKRVPVGVLRKADLELGEQLREALTPEEVKEVEAVASAYKLSEDLRRRQLALSFPAIAREVMEYFSTSADNVERQLIACAVMESIRQLRKQGRES